VESVRVGPVCAGPSLPPPHAIENERRRLDDMTTAALRDIGTRKTYWVMETLQLLKQRSVAES
jgi:hypothetical protein